MAKNNTYEHHFDLYKQYTGTLRNWFVVSGVGGLVLFISHADTFSKCSKTLRCLIYIAFLVAIAVQVIIAGINKYANWFVSEKDVDTDLHKRASSISECIWIDITADVISFLAFLGAAIGLLAII